MFAKLKSFWARRKNRVRPIDLHKRFEIMNKTGVGSMSQVYRARDRKFGRTICLKVLDKLKTARFEARFKGLEREGVQRPVEGAVLMALRHRNTVKCFEHGMTTKGEQFIVMELIEGVGMNFMIETHSKSLEKNRIDYLTQVADGLDYIHRQKYLHRDICPRNIMINNEGVVKLIDFGLAVPYLKPFCRPGNRTGTPNYLAPEVIKRTTTDHRVDLFALGVTAYELFTGMLPWEKSQSLQTILAHLNRAGTDPRVHKPDLDEEIARFLIKAIDRNPNTRFQTAAEFREQLKALPSIEPVAKTKPEEKKS